jgi:hypothetical protein
MACDWMLRSAARRPFFVDLLYDNRGLPIGQKFKSFGQSIFSIGAIRETFG